MCVYMYVCLLHVVVDDDELVKWDEEGGEGGLENDKYRHDAYIMYYLHTSRPTCGLLL